MTDRVAPLLLLVLLATAAAAPTAPHNVYPWTRPTTWDVRLSADPDEPGWPFIMSGRVFGLDSLPAAGITLYVYHADAGGLYARESGDFNGSPTCCAPIRWGGTASAPSCPANTRVPVTCISRSGTDSTPFARPSCPSTTNRARLRSAQKPGGPTTSGGRPSESSPRIRATSSGARRTSGCRI